MFDENLRVYDVREVWRHFGREGIAVARCTVARLTRAMGLQGAARGKPVRATVSDKAVPCPLDRIKRRFHTLCPLAERHEIAKVAATVSLAPCWVEWLLARYNAHGPLALGDQRRQNGASPSVLRPDLLKKLEDRLREPPEDGGRWTSANVAAWMATELGLARLAPQRGWETLKALGWSVQTPRPRHPGPQRRGPVRLGLPRFGGHRRGFRHR